MIHSEEDRVLALAGVFQAAALVHQIAQRGLAATEPTLASIESLFKIDADNVPEVFGSAEGVTTGLRTLCDQLSGKRGKDIQIARYVIALVQLERRLVHRPDMIEQIASGIRAIGARLVHFQPIHSNILAQLAEIYSSTLSTLGPRVMVQGHPQYLSQAENQNRIRALLLAGIRAAYLWRQIGGRRWQIILHRRRILQSANEMLDEIAETKRHALH